MRGLSKVIHNKGFYFYTKISPREELEINLKIKRLTLRIM